MVLTSGTRLGPYEIESALGAGGMWEVYRALDTRLDRIVAIKVLPDTLAIDPQFRERFDREARAISQLDHPHICSVYDVGEERGTSFLVMQYLEGDTLAARLEKGPLPLNEALVLAAQIASALDSAHRAGIVHRDLKPGNILDQAGRRIGSARRASEPCRGAELGRGAEAPGPDTLMAITPGTRLGPYEIESALGAGGMGEVYRARDTRLDRTVAIKVLPDTLAIDPQFRERLDREARAISQLDHQEADARTDVFAFGVAYEMLTGRKACLTVLTRPDRAHGEADRVWPEMLPAGRAVLFTITTTAGGLDAAQVAVLELRPRHTQGARARCYTCARRVQPASRVSLHAIL